MRQITIALALVLSLFGSFLVAGDAEAKRRPRFGGGTDTNYGYAIIDGVFVSFLCTNGTCTVASPDWLAGRTVVYTSGGWVLL